MKNQRNGPVLFRDQCKAGKQVCVGLDPVVGRLPHSLLERSDEHGPELHPFYLFGKEIVDAGHQNVGHYKLNSAYYEAGGWRGVKARERLVSYIHDVVPHIPVIGDGKRGDVGSTCRQYGNALFEADGFDAVTVNPYGGYEDGLDELIHRWPDKLFFVWCRSSNAGAREFQDQINQRTGQPAWQDLAIEVNGLWNGHDNCGLVVAATYPDDLRWARQTLPGMDILSPGLGTQGGSLTAAARVGGKYTTYNNSSQIIFSSGGEDFAQAAAAATEQMHLALTAARQQK